MKLTKEQIEEIKRCWGDWEQVHGKYDNFMSSRLKELDAEFFADLEEAFKGATFWYA